MTRIVFTEAELALDHLAEREDARLRGRVDGRPPGEPLKATIDEMFTCGRERGASEVDRERLELARGSPTRSSEESTQLVLAVATAMGMPHDTCSSSGGSSEVCVRLLPMAA